MGTTIGDKNDVILFVSVFIIGIIAFIFYTYKLISLLGWKNYIIMIVVSMILNSVLSFIVTCFGKKARENFEFPAFNNDKTEQQTNKPTKVKMEHEEIRNEVKPSTFHRAHTVQTNDTNNFLDRSLSCDCPENVNTVSTCPPFFDDEIRRPRCSRDPLVY